MQSCNQIINEYEQRTQNKLEVTRKPRSELEAARKANPADVMAFLVLEIDLGGVLNGKEEDLDNDEFPGWAPTGTIDILELKAAHKA